MPPTSVTPSIASTWARSSGVDVLCPDGSGRRRDQAVEQAAEEHQQHGDQREDDGGGREPAGTAA
jgi:hypothetical protein